MTAQSPRDRDAALVMAEVRELATDPALSWSDADRLTAVARLIDTMTRRTWMLPDMLAEVRAARGGAR